MQLVKLLLSLATLFQPLVSMQVIPSQFYDVVGRYYSVGANLKF